MQPVPIGVAGEIYLGGVKLARGYLGALQNQNEAFLDDVCGFGRLYRTGDRGRWLSTGDVDFLGRTVSSTRSVEKPLHTCKGCVVLLLTHGMQMPLYPATRSVRIAIIACLDESGGSWYDSFIPLLRINIHKLSRRLISHLWMKSTSTTTPIMLVEQPLIHVLSCQEVEPLLRHIPWVQWLNSKSALR